MRLKAILIFMFIAWLRLPSTAASDSVIHKLHSLAFTPRFNTLNMAPVSGNIVNSHVNLDFTFVYTKNRFIWQVVKGVDLEDRHSEMNYFLSNVRYKINFTKRLGLSPFLAFYSEQAYQLVDRISDANGGMLFTYQHESMVIEAFILFVRLTHNNSEKDIINRLEIRYTLKPMVFSAFVYQNTSYFDNKERVAIGFKLTLPGFELFNKVAARSEITGSFRVHETPETKNLNGVFLSLAFPFNL